MLDNGATEGTFIGIFQEPTVSWICSLLAIWKLGAVYVPLDPRESPQRLRTILQDCNPKFILTIDATEERVRAILPADSTAINVSKIGTASRNNIAVQAKADATSTILYTSGSTGKPKGILLNHFGLLNHCIVAGETYGFRRERFLQQSALSFDMSPAQIIYALAFGGSLYVASTTQRTEPVLIAQAIFEEGITATLATPSEYHAWIKHGYQHLSKASSWKYAISGGESITQGLLREFRSCALEDLILLNIYGPSEVSIAAVSSVVDYKSPNPTVPVPLGRPMRNHAVYIVDRDMDEVPIGVDGELIVAGAGIAQGYLNRPDMTSEKFLADTFTERGYFDKGWHRVYRTGDIGRRLADGSILFKGRASGDTQVKLNGIRIELSSIEHVVIESGGGVLTKAVCTVRDGVLVAHVEFRPSYPDSQRQSFLRDLSLNLPLAKYMTPGLMLGLDKMPLTQHGKVDRKAIAELPLHKEESTEQHGHLLATEIILKGIWELVLPAEIVASGAIRPDADFFLCGGSSLSLVNVQSLIRKELQVSLPIIDLLQASELRSMAFKIESTASLADIDWEDETSLEQELIAAASRSSARPDKPKRSIILTGATGHLGGFFLDKLIEDARIDKIHCVAVRPEGTKPRDKLYTSPKVVIHPGNLAEPLLGLSPLEFKRLGHEADAIIHLGANRSFWDHYHATKATNFESTKELVRLSAENKIPLHFMSSHGVLGESFDATQHLCIPETQPCADGTSGYIASKWASEVYIGKAVQMLGLPLHIHRCSPCVEPQPAPAHLLAEFLALADKI